MDGVNTAQEKAALRSVLSSARDGLDHGVAARSDSLISKAVLGLPEFQAADLILTYLSFGSEVDTRALIEAAFASGMRVGLPRVVGAGIMVWHEVNNLHNLDRSSFGILEPSVDAPLLNMASLEALAPLALVPGLAFDALGFRLGYGGGYYDRFLPNLQRAGGVAIGLCRDAAFQESALPREETDVPVDIVVTESGERIRRI